MTTENNESSTKIPDMTGAIFTAKSIYTQLSKSHLVDQPTNIPDSSHVEEVPPNTEKSNIISTKPNHYIETLPSQNA